jgi:cytochrome c oxidase subunit 4
MEALSHSHAHSPGGDHVPHVLPLSVYLKTWGALLAFTAITVGASYVDFGSANLWIAILIATTKALLVASIFMHLKYDQKFHSIIFGMALVFLVVFVGFTMFDTETRGRAESVEADRPLDPKAPFAGSRSEAKMRAKFSPQAASTAAPAGPEHAPAH